MIRFSRNLVNLVRYLIFIKFYFKSILKKNIEIVFFRCKKVTKNYADTFFICYNSFQCDHITIFEEISFLEKKYWQLILTKCKLTKRYPRKFYWNKKHRNCNWIHPTVSLLYVSIFCKIILLNLFDMCFSHFNTEKGCAMEIYYFHYRYEKHSKRI